VAKGIYDKASDRVLQIYGKAGAKITSSLQRTDPYRQEKVNPDDELYHYEQINNSLDRDGQLIELIKRHGEDTVNDWVMRMETLKQKRGLNGV